MVTQIKTTHWYTDTAAVPHSYIDKDKNIGTLAWRLYLTVTQIKTKRWYTATAAVPHSYTDKDKTLGHWQVPWLRGGCVCEPHRPAVPAMSVPPHPPSLPPRLLPSPGHPEKGVQVDGFLQLYAGVCVCVCACVCVCFKVNISACKKWEWGGG